MNRNSLIAFATLLIIILILIAVLIFRKPETIVMSNKEQTLKDSIALLHIKIETIHDQKQRIQNRYDSLAALDPLIIKRTHEKVTFILTDATPDELDSIIKSSIKIKSRYR